MAAYIKLIPIIVSSLVTILGMLSPQIQDILLAYPNVTIALGGLYAILASILPSPVSKK